MVILRTQQFFLSFLLLLSSVSFAQLSDATVDKLLTLTGLTTQVEQFPSLIKAGIDDAALQDDSVTDVQIQLMTNSIQDTIIPAEILAGMRTAIQASLVQSEADQLLAWYVTELGREITTVEEKASTVEAYQDMMSMSAQLLDNKDRVAIAHRYDELLGVTEMMDDLQESLGVAVYTAMMTQLAPDEPLDLEPLYASIAANKAETQEMTAQLVTVSLVYTYLDLPLSKLEKYESFLADSVTKKFNKIVISSMWDGLGTSASKWASALSKQLDERDAP